MSYLESNAIKASSVVRRARQDSNDISHLAASSATNTQSEDARYPSAEAGQPPFPIQCPCVLFQCPRNNEHMIKGILETLAGGGKEISCTSDLIYEMTPIARAVCDKVGMTPNLRLSKGRASKFRNHLKDLLVAMGGYGSSISNHL